MCSCSQSVPSRSRKLVGSSSSRRSGSREQRGRERDAHPPAAGEFGAGALLVGGGEAEARRGFRRRAPAPNARRCRRAGSGSRRCDAGRCAVSASASRRDALLVGPQHDVDAGSRGRRALPAPAGRCGSAAAAAPRRARAAISPVMARNSVVLPVPLRPTSPTRAPVGNVRRGAVEQQAAGNADGQIRRSRAWRAIWPSRVREAMPMHGALQAPARHARHCSASRHPSRRPPCAFPDVRKRCGTRCTPARLFAGAAAAFAATAVVAADRRGRAAAGSASRGRSHPHDVAGLPDLRRHAGHRDAEAQVRLQEGRLQSQPVAAQRACRHASRRADPFFRTGITAEQIAADDAGGAARRDRRAPTRRRRIPTISCHATILPPGSAGTDGCRTTAASPCIRAGRGTSATQAKYIGKDAGGVMHFPGIRSRCRRMAAQGAQGRGACGRHAVARPRRVEGFQDALSCGCRQRALGA